MAQAAPAARGPAVPGWWGTRLSCPAPCCPKESKRQKWHAHRVNLSETSCLRASFLPLAGQKVAMSGFSSRALTSGAWLGSQNAFISCMASGRWKTNTHKHGVEEQSC
jgi:hypothetical protein